MTKKKRVSRWQALEEIETKNALLKQEFFEAQPEYRRWVEDRPSAILKDTSLTVAERVKKYSAASGPESEWTLLDKELSRRWRESGQMIAPNYNVCEFF